MRNLFNNAFMCVLGFAAAVQSAGVLAAAPLMEMVPLSAVPTPQMSYLDNGVISIGVDLNMGGCITYLADSKTKENIVNIHDTGREIQQSYFSGPQPFGTPHAAWANWPWNPIGCGDAYANRAKTLDHMNDGKRIYVKTLPLQFALNNVPCECTFETWIQLQDNAARVTNRLNNYRADKTQYTAMGQELPAVYTIGKLYRIFTYDGPTPFTNAPLRQVPGRGPSGDWPWTLWQPTENWAALVKDSNWGLGVYAPGVHRFMGGFAGTPNTGGPTDDPTGYLSPTVLEIIDAEIVYEYQYHLVLGSLDDIRSYVYANRTDSKPHYRFARDRQHWFYVHCSDGGPPFSGALNVKLEKDDPSLIGPVGFWQASEVPKLYIRAAIRSALRQAEVFFNRFGDTAFPQAQSVRFTVIPDGLMRVYEVPLASSPLYGGPITQIRFDPIPSGAPGENMRLEYLSWRPPLPKLNSLAPARVAAGGAGFDMTLNGEGFVVGSIVQWNGRSRPTTLVSSTELRVSIFASDIAVPGTMQVTVYNPDPANGSSNGLPFSIGPPPPPSIITGGVVNAASFRPQLAGGTVASVFGANLAGSTEESAADPLPTALAGTKVHVNGVAAPLFFVSPNQINFQVPWELLGQTQASISVTAAELKGTAQTIRLSGFAPGIFTMSSAGQGAVLIAATGEVAALAGSIRGMAARPANHGEFLSIYCTGLGSVSNTPASGGRAVENPLSETTSIPYVTIGGAPARVLFAGLAPGFAGLYQVNVQVPESATTGDAVPIGLMIGGVVSNAVTVAIQ